MEEYSVNYKYLKNGDKLQLKREEKDVKFSYLNNGCVVDGETFLPLLLNGKRRIKIKMRYSNFLRGTRL